MKNLLLPLGIICVFLFSGCAPAYKSSTLKALEMEPKIIALPLIADLDVSPQKARGEAKGDVVNLSALEREAVTNALGHNPPSIDKPDLLIGTNFFYEVQGNLASVIAMGYPAFYTNFRTATEEDSVFLVIHKPEKHHIFYQARGDGKQFYISLKYQATAPFSGAGGNLQIGRLNRGFFGADFGGGANDFGGGLSWGGLIKPIDWLQIIPGGSVGFWNLYDFNSRIVYWQEPVWTGGAVWRSRVIEEDRGGFAFGGPFVKLLFGRDKFFGEVSQRFLFGERFASQTMLGFTYIR